MNALHSVRNWLRQCPYIINTGMKLNESFLEAAPGSMSVEITQARHAEDVIGKRIHEYTFAFSVRLPYGEQLAPNTEAAGLCDAVVDWLMTQAEEQHYPTVEGYIGSDLNVGQSGLKAGADANMAVYRIDFSMRLEEL